MGNLLPFAGVLRILIDRPPCLLALSLEATAISHEEVRGSFDFRKKGTIQEFSELASLLVVDTPYGLQIECPSLDLEAIGVKAQLTALEGHGSFASMGFSFSEPHADIAVMVNELALRPL